jgi:flagellar biosynthesis anti-sigma factor FlgM
LRIGDSTKKAVDRLHRKRAEAGKKLDDELSLEKASADKGVAGKVKVAKAGAPAEKAGVDETRLRLEEHKYEVAAAAMARVPDVRPEKAARIEELRAMIANGTYKVDADEIAKRLLNSGLFDDLT